MRHYAIRKNCPSCGKYRGMRRGTIDWDKWVCTNCNHMEDDIDES